MSCQEIHYDSCASSIRQARALILSPAQDNADHPPITEVDQTAACPWPRGLVNDIVRSYITILNLHVTSDETFRCEGKSILQGEPTERDRRSFWPLASIK